VVLDRRRAYSEAVSWVRLARPRHFAKGRWAWRCFLGSFFAGMIVLGLIGLMTPSRFGTPGASAFGSGWPAYVLLALVAACVVVAFLRRRRIGWLIERLREPWRRPLTDRPNYDDAADAIAACPEGLQSRFAASWVWGPMVVAALAVLFAFSTAYFLVDAILQRFVVTVETLVLAAANALVSIILWRLVAVRMSTWRFAASVHKNASTGYL
jgi:hypothetical protein